MLVGLVALGCAGAGVSLALTRPAVGYSTDSAVYLGVARNLVRGRGPTVPMTFYTDRYRPLVAFHFHGAVPSTHFPPLYPAVLALPEALGVSPATSVRALDAILAGVNLVLVALLLLRVFRGRWVSAILGAAVLLTVGTWLTTHAFAMSEALEVTWALGGLVLLARYATTPSTAALVGVAICAAGAVLTRWVGGSFALAAATRLLLRPGWPMQARVRRSAVVLGTAVCAGVAWTAFGAVAGESTPRVFSYHPPRRFLGSLVDVVAEWFVHLPRSPAHVGVFVAVVAVLATAVLASGAARVPAREVGPTGGSEREALLAGLGLFAVAYVAVVFAARTFLDASIPTAAASNGLFATFAAARIYTPLLPVALVLVLAAVDQIAEHLLSGRESQWPALAGVLACAALVAVPPSHVAETYRTASRIVRANSGFGTASPTAFASGGLPAGATIATNSPSAVYGATQRSVLIVPDRRVAITAERNRRFDHDAAEMAAVLAAHNGYLVLFRASFGPSTTATASDFARYAKLVPVGHYADGDIYRVE